MSGRSQVIIFKISWEITEYKWASKQKNNLCTSKFRPGQQDPGKLIYPIIIKKIFFHESPITAGQQDLGKLI